MWENMYIQQQDVKVKICSKIKVVSQREFSIVNKSIQRLDNEQAQQNGSDCNYQKTQVPNTLESCVPGR